MNGFDFFELSDKKWNRFFAEQQQTSFPSFFQSVERANKRRAMGYESYFLGVGLGQQVRGGVLYLVRMVSIGSLTARSSIGEIQS